jgi:hypothetical protein
MIVASKILLDDVTHDLLKGKCRYYDVTIQHVASELLYLFATSNVFDQDIFNFPRHFDDNK